MREHLRSAVLTEINKLFFLLKNSVIYFDDLDNFLNYLQEIKLMIFLELGPEWFRIENQTQ